MVWLNARKGPPPLGKGHFCSSAATEASLYSPKVPWLHIKQGDPHDSNQTQHPAPRKDTVKFLVNTTDGSEALCREGAKEMLRLSEINITVLTLAAESS